MTDNDKRPDKRSMGWYNFLVYFWLFYDVINAASLTVMCLTSIGYGGKETADAVYTEFPELAAVDVLSGIIWGALAVFGIMTRQALYWEKRSGPRYLRWLYIIRTVLSVVYLGLGGLISGGTNLAGLVAVQNLVFGIVMIIVNQMYFSKRKEIFKY